MYMLCLHQKVEQLFLRSENEHIMQIRLALSKIKSSNLFTDLHREEKESLEQVIEWLRKAEKTIDTSFNSFD